MQVTYRMKEFKRIYVEITNACNLKCDFCPQTKRKLEFMSIEMFGKILEQIKGHTDNVYFHVKGEPLLHPELDKFLDISHSLGFKVNITTNGTLINKAKDILLSRPSLRQISFSLHSFDGNEASQSKEEYIRNILSFTKEALKRSETIISFRFWNLDENNVINLKQERNNQLLRYIEKEFNLPYKIQEKIMSERGIKIADRLYLNQDYQFKWPDIEQEDDDKTGFCYGLRNQSAILVDGTVVPCCLDGEGLINLGNINRTSFSEIVKSERARNIVDGFTRREAVEKLCRKCEYRKRFG